MKKIGRFTSVTLILMLCGGLLTGCGTKEGSTTSGDTDDNAQPIAIKIGNLPTEDLLPLWVAQENGYFEEEGLPSVEIVNFQSAQEANTAMASGAIDAMMGDSVNAAALYAGGTKVSMPFVTLGATPEQGRFGILTTKDTGITDLRELANVPIAVGSNTMLEYMMDTLLSDAGVSDEQIKKEEIKKIPARFEMLEAGQVKAAALPNTFLSLGEMKGDVVVADDTQGKNLTQSELIVSDDFTAKDGAKATMAALEKAWNKGVNDVNTDPEKYRELLVKTAKLPDALASSYTISEYPEAAPPTSAMIDPVLVWMKEKGYLSVDLNYDPSDGTFSEK